MGANAGACVCARARAHNIKSLCCYNYDQGNHYHQTPVTTTHRALHFSRFMSEKEGCGRVETTHFQLLLSLGIKHNSFQEQRRNVKGETKRNHSLKTNGK